MKVLIRAIAHQYLDRNPRDGPFVLQLTDINQSNFVVDDYWNVKSPIDLEWICSLTVQMLGPPYWLTGLAVDEIEGDDLESYEMMNGKYLSIPREEETRQPASLLNGLSLVDVSKASWQKGARYFAEKITKETGKSISKYWSQDLKILEAKMAQRKQYDADLRRVFKVRDVGNDSLMSYHSISD
ncbi:hypothetical protein J1614_007447 [Plenodomus biglobosus]|nr:hypothetical protein J1614_007447 [Plenodomus biglobosus]